MTYGLILLSVFLNAAAQIFLRLAARDGLHLDGTVASLVGIAIRPAMIAGIACYGVSLVTWLLVLSRVDVSYAYPFLSLGFIAVAAAGWLFLAEPVSLQRAAALCVIAIGVALLARS